MNRNTCIRVLKGVGDKIANKLKLINILTVEDLLWHIPRTYIDLTKITKVLDTREGFMVVRGTLSPPKLIRTPRKKIFITTSTLTDESGTLPLIWFNQPWVLKQIEFSKPYILYGTVIVDNKGRLILNSPQIAQTATILPIYPLSARISNNLLSKLITQCLSNNIVVPDPLQKYFPLTLLNSFGDVHNPNQINQIQPAKERLAQTELIYYLIEVKRRSKLLYKYSSIPLSIDNDKLNSFIDELSFKLTKDQLLSVQSILKDLSGKYPMNRLLQGDVGSGKTVVAAIAAFIVTRCKYQTIWLAPTTVLTQQHARNLSKLFENFDVSVSIWTANNKQSLDADIIVGTTALISKPVKFNKVGLVIVDEQHRFGVKHRRELIKKSSNLTSTRPVLPHFLSMTATPIPRSLALTLFGDLDQSVIKTMPPGRQKILTSIYQPSDRFKAYKTIIEQLNLGRQAYIIVPLVEDSNDYKSVTSEVMQLSSGIFKNYKLSGLHGRLNSTEKNKIMNNFVSKKIDILISTTVIEVGIDVSNATVILIEGADRFGLATLHQLRGRVGRGENQSYCLLIPSKWTENISIRLRAMQRYNDGFSLSEVDLKLRGPGQMAGLVQSGLPEFKVARITDLDQISQANVMAEKILKTSRLDAGLEAEIKLFNQKNNI